MRIIKTGRRGGKTTEIIKAADKSGGYIVCANHSECVRVAKQAQELKLSIPFPLTFDEFVSRRFHVPGVRKFHIDNADWLLQFIAWPVPVETVSFDVERQPDGGREGA